jgi:penicillin-binding protein 1A
MYEPFGFPRAYSPPPVEAPKAARAKRPLRFLSGLANGFLIVSLGFLGMASALTVAPYKLYPLESTLRPASKRPLVMRAADGEVFARRGECVAEPVTVQELPQHLVDALVSMEDRRFYDHMGIDPRGIARAAVRNYESGNTREGGSTITQQLVKMSFLSSAKTIERKLEEAMLATWLEFRLTKDQILERYLNSAYFGEGCYGVRAAARHFFGKPIDGLDVAESALLVSLLRSPTQLTSNIDDAHQRAKLVLQAMVREGRLEEARLSALQPAALDAARAEELGSYYADWLGDLLQKELGDNQSRQPVQVYSTFEPTLQRLAQDAVRTVLDKQGGRVKASQAALVAMRTDGRVVAMVGGRERAASQFNRAVQAKRQPGSAFKTFVYLTALRAGMRPDMVVADEPISIDGWEPKNFGGKNRGSVTLSQAFATSINTVAVKLSEAVGREAVMSTAHKLGIVSPLAPNASLALGTSEVSLLELTSAYAAVAAGFYPVKPWAVAGLDAKPADGGHAPDDSGLWKLPERDEIRELLSGVVHKGSGRAASLPIATYGKTGTSQDHRDAWFVGFAGNLVVGVWVGNDDFSPMRGVTGGSLPASIWKTFMRAAMKEDDDFQKKLPRIALFETRGKTPTDRPPSLAALETVVVATETKPSRSIQYGHISARSPAMSYNDIPDERPAPRVRARSDLDERLREMGWPGGR